MNVFCVLEHHDKCNDTACDCSCHNQSNVVTELPVEQHIPDLVEIEIAAEIETGEIPVAVTVELECDCCPNKVNPKNTKKYAGMIMCDECYTKEMALKAESEKPENIKARMDAAAADMEMRRKETPAGLNMNRILQQGREIDAQIKVRTDIFNAQTVAIAELKKAIDEDTGIENKNLALATELDTRFATLKQAIFELNEEVIAKSNEQKAIQTYLNQLVNRLRAEEREKFKQHDMTYVVVAAPKPTRVKGPAKPTIDKVELMKYSKELGLPPNILQMMTVARNMTLLQAYTEMKKQMGK